MSTIQLQPIYLCPLHGEVLANKVMSAAIIVGAPSTVLICPSCYQEVRPRIDQDQFGNEIPVYGQATEGEGYWRKITFEFD